MSNSTTMAAQIKASSIVSRTVRLLSPGRIQICQTNRAGQTERTCYLLARLESEVGGEAFQLRKIEQATDPLGRLTSYRTTEAYHVLVNGQASSCSCADFTFRGHQRPCKHIAAVQALQAQGKLPVPVCELA